MLNQEQLDYINSLKDNHSGIEDQALRDLLKKAGWSDSDIEESLSRYKGEYVEEMPPPPPSDLPNTDPQNKVTKADASSQSDDKKGVPTNNEPAGKKFATKSKLVNILLIVFATIVVIASVVVAYNKFSFLLSPKVDLTNGTILKTTLNQLAKLNSSEYTVELSANVTEREEGVVSYKDILQSDPEYEDKKARDQDRIRDAYNIITNLSQTSSNNQPPPEEMVYPASLRESEFKLTDPLGIPYAYMQTDNGEGFMLTVTFETEQMISALTQSSLINTYEVADKNVTFTQNSHIYIDSLYSKLDNPAFLDNELAFFDRFIDSDFNFKIVGSGTFDTSGQSADGKFGFTADASFADSNFSVAAELLKDNDDIYFIVRKFPVLFANLGQVKGKWVHATKEEIEENGFSSYGFVGINALNGGMNKTTEDKALVQEYKEQVMLTVDKADQARVLEITGEEEIVLEEKELTKYTLNIRTENLISFYKDMLEVYEDYEHPLVEKSAEMEKYINSQQTKNLLKYLEKNVVYNLYFDGEGFPVRFEITLRHIPSSEGEKVANKQLNLTTSIALSEINKPIELNPPTEFLSFDEALEIVTGKTKEEIMMERQIIQVRNIRAFLELHKNSNPNYPTSLAEVEAISSTTLDVYTDNPYDYQVKGDDYSLIYNIDLPDVTQTDSLLKFYTDSDSVPNLLVPRHYDGENEATSEYISTSVKETADTDNDNLADALEKIIGTDSAKPDTDNDGVDDYQEVKDGSNPIGPGRL